MSNRLPKPFLGRLLVEVIEVDVEAHMKAKAGISSDSLIALPESFKDKHRVPIKKGKIVDMAPDAFGELFIERRGSDVGFCPDMNDIVWFIPNETYPVDVDGKFHLVNDSDIVAYDQRVL